MARFFRNTLFIIVGLLLLINIMPLLGQDCKTQASKTQYDLIIVLGNPATNTCQPTSMMKERVNKAVELYKQNFAQKILLTGSSVANKCVEADVMAEYAISMGIPDSCIIKERNAQNTYQNAFYSVEQMRKLNLTKVAIVTSKFHIRRSCNIFSNYNIQYSMYPADTSEDLSYFRLLCWSSREKIILTYHTLFGYSKTFGLRP